MTIFAMAETASQNDVMFELCLAVINIINKMTNSGQ